jgi:hypothetical protein
VPLARAVHDGEEIVVNMAVGPHQTVAVRRIGLE